MMNERSHTCEGNQTSSTSLGHESHLPGSLRSEILRDFKGVIILVLISALLGFGLNFLQKDPLPLVYQTKEERLHNDTAELQAGIQETEDEDIFSVSQEMTIPEVDIEQTREMINTGQAIIIDVRADVFYEEGHIPGAINLPRSAFKSAYTKVKPILDSSRDKMLIVYCSGSSCKDSHLVAGALMVMGYSSIFVFKGGWEEWSISGERTARL